MTTLTMHYTSCDRQRQGSTLTIHLDTHTVPLEVIEVVGKIWHYSTMKVRGNVVTFWNNVSQEATESMRWIERALVTLGYYVEYLVVDGETLSAPMGFQ